VTPRTGSAFIFKFSQDRYRALFMGLGLLWRKLQRCDTGHWQRLLEMDQGGERETVFIRKDTHITGVPGFAALAFTGDTVESREWRRKRRKRRIIHVQ
jgi:hypothetical protein